MGEWHGVLVSRAVYIFWLPHDLISCAVLQVGNDVQPDGYVPVICGLSRTKIPDLERAWEAVRHAKRPRVHTFLATSEIHMKYKLKMTREQVRWEGAAVYDVQRWSGDSSLCILPAMERTRRHLAWYECGMATCTAIMH